MKRRAGWPEAGDTDGVKLLEQVQLVWPRATALVRRLGVTRISSEGRTTRDAASGRREGQHSRQANAGTHDNKLPTGASESICPSARHTVMTTLPWACPSSR